MSSRQRRARVHSLRQRRLQTKAQRRARRSTAARTATVAATTVGFALAAVPVTYASGSDLGVAMVADINPGAGDGSPLFPTDVNGTLYFSADDGSHGYELWKSDGTTAGTSMVADINPGAAGSTVSWPTDVNGTLYFTAYDDAHGYQLWKSGGTAATTTRLTDLTGHTGAYGPRELTDVNGTLYFSADDGTHGYELWTSDGTAAGTTMVADNNPGAGSSYGRYLTNVDGSLYFVADDGSHGQELWKSDGTAAGTSMVADINPGTGDASIGNLTVVSGALYFTADDGTHGQELWKSDGTAAGTSMVADINPGTGDYLSSYPGSLTNVNGSLFFAADDGTHGEELWTSDGTEAGTTMVDDISPGGSYPGSLTDVNGSLFFAADDGIHGGELWTSDGTEAGTTMVADINPAGDSYVGELTVANGTLFLCATDGTHGAELWTSDGTAAGTVMVGDIDPGPADGLSWIDATAVGGTLFFRADDGTHGVELWKSGTLVTSSVPPSISGTPKVGSVLAADPGAWSQPGASFSYAWSADGSSVGSDASTYTPTAADVGKAITVTVTASASGFLDGTATSAPTAPVAPAAGTQIANTAPPVIAGTPQVGSTLTVSGTAWSPADAVTSYQWLANGVPIAGATGATFTLTGGQVGARISVSATGTKSGYTSATVTSASTGVVVVTPLVDTHAKVKRAKRLVKLVVGVGADGVAPVSGTVKIVRDGKLVSKVQVSGGRVVVKLRHQPRGKHVYKITYLGEGPVLRSVQKLHIRI